MSNVTTDFITATKRIHTEVRNILTTLHLIREDVKLIREQTASGHDTPSADTQATDTQEKPKSNTSHGVGGELKAGESDRTKDHRSKDQNGKLSRFIKLWGRNLRKPRFQVEIAALIGLFWYTYEARQTNKLTEDSVRARLVIPSPDSGWNFTAPITVGNRIGMKANLKNIGRSQAFYGLSTEAHEWTGMPDGEIPLTVQDVSVPLEPDVEVEQKFFDTDTATQEFIDGIPTLSDLSKNFITSHLDPSTTKRTLFFIGKLVYSSLGRRREKEFCFYVVRIDDANRQIFPWDPKAIDPNYMTMACPKWNSSNE